MNGFSREGDEGKDDARWWPQSWLLLGFLIFSALFLSISNTILFADSYEPSISRDDLLEKIKSQDISVEERVSYLESLRQFGYLLDREVQDLLSIGLDTANDTSLRKAALRTLSIYLSQNNRIQDLDQKLIPLLESQNSTLIEVAGNLLGFQPPPPDSRAIDILLRLIDADASDVRTAVFGALNSTRIHQNAIRIAKQLREDFNDPKIFKKRKIAILDFFSFTNLEVGYEESLQIAEKSDDPDLKAHALAAFLSLRNRERIAPGISKDLLKIALNSFQSPHENVAQQSARLLAHLRDEESQDHLKWAPDFSMASRLILMLTDSKIDVRNAANDLLFKIQVPEKEDSAFQQQLETLFFDKMWANETVLGFHPALLRLSSASGKARIECALLSELEDKAVDRFEHGKSGDSHLEMVIQDLVLIGADATIQKFSEILNTLVKKEVSLRPDMVTKILDSKDKEVQKTLELIADYYFRLVVMTEKTGSIQEIFAFLNSTKAQEALKRRVSQKIADFLIDDKKTPLENRARAFRNIISLETSYFFCSTPSTLGSSPFNFPETTKALSYFMAELFLKDRKTWDSATKRLEESYGGQMARAIPELEEEAFFYLTYLRPALNSKEGEELIKSYSEKLLESKEGSLAAAQTPKVKLDPENLASILLNSSKDLANHAAKPVTMTSQDQNNTGDQEARLLWLAEELLDRRVSDETVDAVIEKILLAKREDLLQLLILERHQLTPASVKYVAEILDRDHFSHSQDFHLKIVGQWNESAFPIIAHWLDSNVQDEDKVRSIRLWSAKQQVTSLHKDMFLASMSESQRAHFIHILSGAEIWNPVWAENFIRELPDHEDKKYIPTDLQVQLASDILVYLLTQSEQLGSITTTAASVGPSFLEQLKSKVHFIYYTYPIHPTVCEPLFTLVRCMIQKHPEWSKDFDAKELAAIEKCAQNSGLH